ncbi:MAG: methyltransferase domain-containing protein [Nanoarchaeota archaeon]|nr:methyltransferase domain-containing protein [Nanoarchaeota archaeon]
MKYLFVLGRNIELSKAEVFSYFEKAKNPVLESEIDKNGLLIEVANPLENNSVDFFGGVISIGKVLVSGNLNEVLNGIPKGDLYSGTGNKLNYTLWDFSKNYGEILKTLKEKFRNEKLKATLKHLTGNVKMQGGKNFEIPSSKLIDEEYFVFGEEKIYFGKISQRCDYSSLEKRDMKKPVRRESLAISPRVAKILINLSGIKSDEVLLDPFCGVGAILQEALIQKIKVIGIDKDKNAISGARQNLDWFKFDKKDYELINEDSSKAKILEANAIATEPDLGETLKKIPQKKDAQKTLEKFENLIVKIINNFKNKISGRIVFTSPYIRVGKKRVKCDIEKILEKTGLNLIYEIPEFRENQIVGRMIYVLDK